MKTTVIIPAAGSGKRMNSKLNKQFLEINNKPIIEYTIEAFENNEDITDIIIVTKETEIESIKKIIRENNYKKIEHIVTGGNERQDSINNALKYIADDCKKILIHDGARPFIEGKVVKEVVNELNEYDAIAVGVPVKDSLKLISDEHIKETVERKNIYAIQTPQAFKKEVILKAYKKAYEENYYGTDDTELVERMGVKTKIIEGSYDNIKITTQEDLLFGEAIAKKGKKEKQMRIGNGYDVHQLVENRKLIIGGVEIPYEKGLLGHSDADVLIHGIMDAILGALALGDIGKHFPDNDDKYKGISSIKLLEEVKLLIDKQDYKIGNIDATIIAERPKMAPFIEEMRKNIASSLDCNITQINVKATTTEKLGFEGKGQGISSQSTVLLIKK